MPTSKQPRHPSGQVVSARLDPATIARLDALEATTNRSRGNYLRLATRALLVVMEQPQWQEMLAQHGPATIERRLQEVAEGAAHMPDSSAAEAELVGQLATMLITWGERIDRSSDNLAQALVGDLESTFEEYGFDVEEAAEGVEPWWEKHRRPRIAEAIWQEKLAEQ
ncbi:MAG: hypothetical protein SPI83_00530 [Rothia sp. (in: high G+C Gram-positive bacteria)]|nr:hypothetical protein [Rothia sp. (in: high G+C Gram-positive bacteria)]